MAPFEPFDVVAVPFPFVEQALSKRLPAVVVSRRSLFDRTGLLWLLMITSAKHRPWPEDVLISDLAGAGLPAPSIVRVAKIATLEAMEARRLGALSEADRKLVRAGLERLLPS